MTLPLHARRRSRLLPALLVLALPALSLAADNGLLFYLSGDKGTTADVAGSGSPEPTFDAEVKVIADGAKGAALSCADLQRLAWRAPGSIYAQRGTLSFFWRSRYPVGPTEFPIFRVGYADHSSWDMAWLRIDYNGHGFDAFVTDTALARTRVSVAVPAFPKPAEWVHLTLAWDETRGIRFYVNGQLAAKQETTALYGAALDQFGPHSRIISPHNVQSDYNFVRGGDIDEIRIYDRMLADADVAGLARGEGPAALPALPPRDLAERAARDEWAHRYGWDHGAPPALPAAQTSVRKVEILEAYDLKRWWWKANDGIPETTWPGVYNRSRLPGRNDYFQLPDWDCYVDGGKAITFALPAEPWNHLEISGAAWGKMELLPAGTVNEDASGAKAERVLFERAQGNGRTVHTLAQPLTGRQIRFTNVEQEEPINELSAYNVTAGTEPAGSTKLAYRLAAQPAPGAVGLAPLQEFIAGRYAADERATLVAVPAVAGAVAAGKSADVSRALPLVHVVIPNTWDNLTDGLDGIAIDLPALKVRPTSGDSLPMNITVLDPLWPMRQMLDFSFSVKPGEAHTLWLDLRDRLLPPGKALYLTVAAAGAEFGPAAIEGATVRLVFKPRAAALAEHEADRFTQARDCYAMLVEEHPHSPKLAMWVRFEQDLKDLLRVSPDHALGRQYAAAGLGLPPPPFVQPAAPAGVPLWAFRQTELLGRVKRFVLWYVDHRQAAFGDFGGGISDDVDLLNTWPGIALMGGEPEKIQKSLHALLEAAFKNGMFTNGLPSIQADELHSYEEGINCLAQNLILEFGSPRQLERAMATARGVEWLTGVNAAGHRHIRSSYYNGRKMAEDAPWNRSKPYSYLVVQPGELLVEFNGSPAVKKYTLELADGLLAHRKADDTGRFMLPGAIVFPTDEEAPATRGFLPNHLFWGAWKWTGDRRYLAPILDAGTSGVMGINANALDLLGIRADWGARIQAGEKGRATDTRQNDGRGSARSNAYRYSAADHFVWQLAGDKTKLEKLYAAQIEDCNLLQFINTEGSLWIDRVGAPTAELQRARLGGIALVRNGLFPGHVVSWKFAAPANDQSVALLVNDATPTAFKVIAYNLETVPVRATMTGWNIDPGLWEITQGLDTNDDDVADQALASRTAPLERSGSVELTLAPRAATVLTFKLKTPGTPYWSRPDLGLDPEDVVVNGREVKVTVHSLGAVASPGGALVLRDRFGVEINTSIPSLPAPVDLQPKTATVIVNLQKEKFDLHGFTVELHQSGPLEEITALNNAVKIP